MKIEVNTHERCMLDFANKHPETLVLSADLGTSCEVKKFRAEKPDQYLTMGIAEQNMCSWAAGLAREVTVLSYTLSQFSFHVEF